jgi:hypothetical protein
LDTPKPGLAGIAVPLAFEPGSIKARERRDCIELFVSGGPRFICFVEKRHAAALGRALIKLGGAP